MSLLEHKKKINIGAVLCASDKNANFYLSETKTMNINESRRLESSLVVCSLRDPVLEFPTSERIKPFATHSNHWETLWQLRQQQM